MQSRVNWTRHEKRWIGPPQRYPTSEQQTRERVSLREMKRKSSGLYCGTRNTQQGFQQTASDLFRADALMDQSKTPTAPPFLSSSSSSSSLLVYFYLLFRVYVCHIHDTLLLFHYSTVAKKKKKKKETLCTCLAAV